MPPVRKPRPRPDLESNTAPDILDEDRRRDLPESRPDTLGERGEGEEAPAAGGFSPTDDGGNPQHPVHDEDEEDMKPEDYEREIDGYDGPVDKFDADRATVL